MKHFGIRFVHDEHVLFLFDVAADADGFDFLSLIFIGQYVAGSLFLFCFRNCFTFFRLQALGMISAI